MKSFCTLCEYLSCCEPLVEIQENRHLNLLNSRSEFNCCAVPRLMCKLGDKTFKKHELEMETDMAREDMQVSKIRDLIKEGTDTEARDTEPSKNPKLQREDEARQEPSASPQEQPRQKKRKIDQNQETQPLKRRAQSKPRSHFLWRRASSGDG